MKNLFNISYPNNVKSAVHEAVHSWKEFCLLPKEEKCAFTFLEDSHGDGAGYELKEEKGNTKDLKENFHITPYQYPRLSNIANRRSLPFLHDAKSLLDQLEPLIAQFCESIEKDYQVEGFTEEVLSGKEFWILRYLHYFGDTQVGDELAKPHIDKGGFTLHLYESDEGLEYYCTFDRTWNPMPISEQETVIIPAAQLQLCSEGKLKALYHRVTATKQTAQTGRFSMVCFVPLQNIPQYNKKAHGSMQTHELGFNYDLSHETYVKLFSY